MKNRLYMLIGLVFLIGGLALTFQVFATAFGLGFALGLCNSSLDPNCELAAIAFLFLLIATIACLVATILATVATIRRRPRRLMQVATVGFALTAVLGALAATRASWIWDLAIVPVVAAAILGILAAVVTAQWERVIRTASE
jgi:hypothetical protein